MSRKSFVRRIEALVKHLDPLDRRRLADDPWWQSWCWFREFAIAVLQDGGHFEALELVRQRIASNEPCLFPGKGPQPTKDGEDDWRHWIMCGGVWSAVGDFPRAEAALKAALQASSPPNEDFWRLHKICCFVRNEWPVIEGRGRIVEGVVEGEVIPLDDFNPETLMRRAPNAG